MSCFLVSSILTGRASYNGAGGRGGRGDEGFKEIGDSGVLEV